MSKTKVLFVCLGNICRSPMSEGTFRHLVQQQGLEAEIEIDSCATGDWHTGEKPDKRAQAASLNRGFDISGQSARQIKPADFDNYDYILAMDDMNYGDLQKIIPEQHRHKLHYFLSFAPETGVKEVPDPYYGGTEGFETVLDLVAAASMGLLEDIRSNRA